MVCVMKTDRGVHSQRQKNCWREHIFRKATFFSGNRFFFFLLLFFSETNNVSESEMRWTVNFHPSLKSFIASIRFRTIDVVDSAPSIKQYFNKELNFAVSQVWTGETANRSYIFLNNFTVWLVIFCKHIQQRVSST